MKKPIRIRALAFKVFYWFTITTKRASMSCGNILGCLLFTFQQAPTCINN